MTDYYIDANRGSDANNGTSKNTAWASLEAIRTKSLTGTIAAGDNFLFESSCQFTPTRYLRFGAGAEPNAYINGTAGNLITFDKYDYSSSYSGNPEFTQIYTPTNSDWVWDAANSLWYFVHPTEYGNTLLNFGQWPYVTVNGAIAKITRQATPTFKRGAWPFAYGEVATWYESNPGRLYVWTPSATSNPLTNPYNVYGPNAVKIASYSFGIFQFQRCGSYITVQNLTVRNGIQLAGVYNDASGFGEISNFTLNSCSSLSSSSLITLAMLDAINSANNITISNNYSEATPGGAIQGGAKILLIKNNTFAGSNYSRNDGGAIYAQGIPGGSTVIQDNIFSDCRYETSVSSGPLDGASSMNSDGCAIYLETGSHDVTVRRNKISNCPLAMQDNTGHTTNVWHSNWIDNCDKGITITDQGNVATVSSVTKVYNNTFSNMRMNSIYSTMPSARWAAIVCRKGTPAAANYTYDFKNNIITGIGTSTTSGYGFLVEAGTSQTYSNNSVYGFNTVKADEYTYANVTTPATTITANPLVRTDGAVSLGSPCIKAGIATGLTLTDNENNLFGITPTVGAFEFNAFRDIRWVFE